MGVTALVFAVELKKVRIKCIFSERRKRKKVLKNPFLQNLHRDITFRTQRDKESVQMKIKVNN